MLTSRQQQREELKGNVKAALEKGWTMVQLAALFRLSVTAIRSYLAGTSMGNNDLRMALAVLRKPEEERKRIEDAVKRCREVIEAKSQDLLYAEQASQARLDVQKRDIKIEKARLKVLEPLL